MLHHAALEISPDHVADDSRFWTLAGFEEVDVPEALRDSYTWFEKAGTQIHLVQTENPVIPVVGHVAIVARDFEETLKRLVDGGFEADERRELWGARRVKLSSPSGHKVEIMAAAPSRSAKSA
ncbi:MAG: hypothetical protein JJE13_04930 [Thermoleophilia bacterium]|nr:hypothetical protein [Thermoleophilia bacterium]